MEKVGPKHTEGWGIPLIQRLLQDLLYLAVLRKANEQIFHEYIDVREPERMMFMDKYAVEIDPAKVEKEKLAHKGVPPKPNPNVNIPLDPDLGSEPYEKEPDDVKKSPK
jgi:hypothetical protein